MKKLFVIALGFILAPQAKAQPAVLIAEYRFDTLMVTPPASSGLYGTSYRYYCNPLVLSSAGNFYQAGLTTVNGGYFTTGHPPASITNRGFIGANWAQTLNTGKYMGFSLTPIVGQTLVIDSISQWSAKSNQGPDTTRMRFGPLFTANSWYTVNVGDVSWRRSSRTTGLPSSSSTIHVRYYTYHNLLDPNPSGTWRVDDIKVYGHLLNVFNLPISLLSFNGTEREQDVLLDWSTATETGNDYFTVEKSYDLETWEEVGREPGAGTSVHTRSYSIPDPHPLPGWNYYRLKQTDFDGTEVISASTEVLWRARGPTQAYSLDGRLIDDWSDEHLDLPRWQIYILRDAFGRATRYYAP